MYRQKQCVQKFNIINLTEGGCQFTKKAVEPKHPNKAEISKHLVQLLRSEDTGNVVRILAILECLELLIDV